MLLEELVAALPFHRTSGRTDLEIRGIAYDSRRCAPGYLFVAWRGFVHDGHDFVGEAHARGAVAACVEREIRVPAGMTRLVVPDARAALGYLASAFYGHPAKKMRLIGVTGTNGKTTTTYLVRSVLAAAGKKTGLIGTVQYLVGDKEYPVVRTTPESLDLQRMLDEMARAFTEAVVMEVSSHALWLHRVVGCEFDAGVFTNLSQDHLEHHQTMERYLQAKSLLFETLGSSYWGPPKAGPKVAVLNADDPASQYIAERTPARVMWYGLREGAQVRGEDVVVTPRGVRFVAVTPAGRLPLELALTGRFNAYNALAAVAVGLAEGVPLDAIRRGLEAVRGVPGRFEAVDEGQDFAVVVDYAHTPDGLENVLQTARELTRGRVIAVFGAGGDRDRTKRPLMGEAAGRLSDVVVLTSDNPRSEDPTSILRDIEAGLARVRKRGDYHLVVDRKEAISRAIRMARTGDLVLIAGKGHETYQIFHDRTVPFDDREVARQVLRRLRRRGRRSEGGRRTRRRGGGKGGRSSGPAAGSGAAETATGTGPAGNGAATGEPAGNGSQAGVG